MPKNEADSKRMLDPKTKYKMISESQPSKKTEENEMKTEPKWFIDPNHTYFILVDNGTSNKFKTEVDLRIQLEDKIDTMWQNCASVLACLTNFYLDYYQAAIYLWIFL